jgi:hypothetical protein
MIIVHIDISCDNIYFFRATWNSHKLSFTVCMYVVLMAISDVNNVDFKGHMESP